MGGRVWDFVDSIWGIEVWCIYWNIKVYSGHIA